MRTISAGVDPEAESSSAPARSPISSISPVRAAARTSPVFATSRCRGVSAARLNPGPSAGSGDRVQAHRKRLPIGHRPSRSCLFASRVARTDTVRRATWSERGHDDAVAASVGKAGFHHVGRAALRCPC